MRTAIALLIALILATVAFALLGIWTGDGRWGWTAGVTGGLALLAGFPIAFLLDEMDRRR
jgi:hypothetical protein